MYESYTRRNTNRIPQHNYSAPGQYFVTVNSENHKQLFGTINNGQMILNEPGKMVNTLLQQIPENYPGTQIDQHIVMPNHIHAIIIIQNVVGVDPRVDPETNNESYDNNKLNHSGRTQGSAPTILSLSHIAQRFKTLTTKKYIDGIKNNNWPAFNKRLWQRNYHDHIIRNDRSLNEIRQYIRNNPTTWQFDVENPDRIGIMESDIINV